MQSFDDEREVEEEHVELLEAGEGIHLFAGVGGSEFTTIRSEPNSLAIRSATLTTCPDVSASSYPTMIRLKETSCSLSGSEWIQFLVFGIGARRHTLLFGDDSK